MFSLGKNCAQAADRWGQKSVGKHPQLPHLFYSAVHRMELMWEKLLSFTTKPPFESHVFPRQILRVEQRKITHISTVSTPPITTTTIYI